MGNDVTVTEAITTVSSSGVDTDVSISADSTTVEVAGADQIVLNQQATEVSVGYTTTTVEIDENATQLSVVSPHYSAEMPFSTDVSVPYLSSFKSSTIYNGITQGFSLGLTDSTTTTLQCFGDTYVLGDTHTLAIDSHNINLDGRNISIDASSTLELVGDRTNIFCQSASLKLGNEKGQNAQDLGARLSSAGSPYTGIFAIENRSAPNTSESLCPFIILEGKIDNAPYPNGATQEFAHIGVGGFTGGGYNARYPIIINPQGFGIRLVYSTNSSFSGLQPIDEDGGLADASHSLGMQFSRWSTVYLASNPIVGSDASLKQDIENLDDAERRVAVACKGLLKKYRLRQSVEEKGDDARIHFGIVAQELQQAFNAEGLEPERYAMFCSDTAYEHEGNIYSQEEAPEDAVEITRLSVRYEQLLAFIVASI